VLGEETVFKQVSTDLLVTVGMTSNQTYPPQLDWVMILRRVNVISQCTGEKAVDVCQAIV
jgi:hypothetical protein